MTIKEFHNKETGMTAKVEQTDNGKFKVSLIDSDTGRVVPATTIFYPSSMKERALEKAEEVMK